MAALAQTLGLLEEDWLSTCEYLKQICKFRSILIHEHNSTESNTNRTLCNGLKKEIVS